MPEKLPPVGEGAEVGFVRFMHDVQRITVVRVAVTRQVPHPLTTAPVPAVVAGWSVALNDEPLDPARDPFPFVDACLVGWAVFAEFAPNAAKVLRDSLAWRAAREEWDIDDMEVTVRHAGVDEGASGGAGVGEDRAGAPAG